MYSVLEVHSQAYHCRQMEIQELTPKPNACTVDEYLVQEKLNVKEGGERGTN